MYIYIYIYGSGNGPSHVRLQGITWTSGDLYLIGPITANFSLDVVYKIASILVGSETVDMHFIQPVRHMGSYITILPPLYTYGMIFIIMTT